MSNYKYRGSFHELSIGFIRDPLSTPDFPANRKFPSMKMSSQYLQSGAKVVNPSCIYRPINLPHSIIPKRQYKPPGVMHPNQDLHLYFKPRDNEKLPPLMPMMHMVKRKVLSERAPKFKTNATKVASLANLRKL
jgi:hypothetical protein